jgi:hypothetical protein
MDRAFSGFAGPCLSARAKLLLTRANPGFGPPPSRTWRSPLIGAAMRRAPWCGPAVVCALKGQPLSRVEAVLMDMGIDPAATCMEDMERTFRRLAGMTVQAVEWWDEPSSSPRLIDWLAARPWRWRLEGR